jgi:serine protease inhibitor
VTEAGTVATAATGISAIPVSASTGLGEIEFNRPFLCLIRDTTTGTILFASLVQNPMLNS